MIFYGDYIGILFPHTLLTTSKFMNDLHSFELPVGPKP